MMILDFHRVLVLGLLVVNGLGAQEIASVKGGRKLSWQDEEHVLDNKLTDRDICEPARQAGVDFETLGLDVGHAIHSFTVEDVQDFFDERFPVQNNIPTVNPNLTAAVKVLSYTPSYPSEFKLPLARAFDVLLQNNDDTEAFLVSETSTSQGNNHLAKFTHQIHMMEMWNMASTVYKSIAKKKLDLNRVCPCIVDEQSNGIMDNLKLSANMMRNMDPETERQNPKAPKGRESRMLMVENIWSLKDSTETENAGRERREAIELYSPTSGTHQELTDSKSWAYWKKFIMHIMPKDNETRLNNLAMYMYCKINLLK